ncbi:MAG TPA: ATP-binding protein, partial [Burkholderiaceae bacterium]|nr:ATP-binding protein [Burkholderiaceae bacterium]
PQRGVPARLARAVDDDVRRRLMSVPGVGDSLPPGWDEHRSPRWLVEDATRGRHAELHRSARAAHAQPNVTLLFGDGSELALPVQPRGIAALGGVYWLLNGIGLLLYLAVVFALLTRRSTVNVLFAIASLCQLGNLALSAVESTQGLGLHPLLSQWDLPARMAFDLVTAAAAVHGASLLFPPGHAAGARRLAVGSWIAVAVLVALAARGDLPGAWWWAQGGVAALCLLAIQLLQRAEQVEPHPVAGQLRRIGSVVLGTWLLLTFALAASQRWPVSPQPVAELAATVWYVCLASLLLLMPFFLRGQQLLREFALLAAIGTIAVSLNLLLVALFALGQLPSMALSLVLSLALYAVSRQWILDQLLGSGRLTTERMFDQLYRIAREVEAHPRRVPALLLQLLRELFEPLQAETSDGPARPRTQVEQNGTVLTVPIATLTGEGDGAPTGLRLRHAQRGRRIFTREDARLADRIVEQLTRAVAFDHAVEQGRREERMRLAQDLHDDIGARLLTLIYKAPTPELEEYVRHTLKDLKTLTRGLAASGHKLGDAAAEWKADLTQRLTAADIELGWSFGADREFALGVVQWSALTRIIRELVSNAIAHARATRVDVTLELAGGTMALCVADNGVGVEPRTWSHGLGISGVRKRVKQLGGEVRWDVAAGGGVACRVRIQLDPVSD